MSERRKIYTSFHELSPSEYMYFPKGSIDAGNPGRFSSLELRHLLISMAVLTLAFSFAFSGNSILYGFTDLRRLVFSIPIAFLGILTAFFFHELSHKFMAQKYGLWAEYRMYPNGLLLSLIFAVFTGFVFAAPGAVMFQGGSHSYETGRIAAAGPSANIVIAFCSFLVYRIFFEIDSPLLKIIGFICLINALLATFNLVPLGPLDGNKVIRWNGIVWASLFIVSLVLLLLILPIAPLF